MKKKHKSKNNSWISVIVFVLTYVVVVILDAYTKGKNLFINCLMIGMQIIATIYFIISMVLLLKALWPIFSKWYKNWSAIIWVIGVTLAIPVAIHLFFYREETINQDTLISAYTQYLSFVGAFALGYFLYKREEIKNFEVLKKKARLIYESIQYIQLNLDNLDSFVERGEIYPIDESWQSNYLDIKHLVKYDEPALGDELQYFFGRVNSINKAIEAGDKERTQKLYLDFVQKEQYAFSAYNYMEAGFVMLDIALDMRQGKTWKEKEKDQIEKFADEFFGVVNLWVYNYLIKNHLSTCDLTRIESELVERLLQHPELNAWVKNSYEKRKITAVIFSIALLMKEKSPNLNYSWGMFSRK